MTMIKANVFEVKARLSHYLAEVERGECVVICKRNQPVAELRAVSRVASQPRPVGAVKGVVVPASFFDPLPPDVLETFYPGAEAPRVPRPRTQAAAVAKRAERPYGARRRAKTRPPRRSHR